MTGPEICFTIAIGSLAIALVSLLYGLIYNIWKDPSLLKDGIYIIAFIAASFIIGKLFI